MKIKTREEEDVLILSVEGDLSRETADDFQLALMDLYEKGGAKVIVDMEIFDSVEKAKACFI